MLRPSPFHKHMADRQDRYRRPSDFVMILSVHEDDDLGPSYDVVRSGESQVIYAVRGPKETRLRQGETAVMDYVAGSHYYPTLRGAGGGYSIASILSDDSASILANDDYVLRSGDTLSGVLEGTSNQMEVDFVNGLLVFQQKAGAFAQGNDLALSSITVGQVNLAQLRTHAARH